MTYKSYHTDLKLAYVFGQLTKEEIKKIPSSTRFNWDNYDFSDIFGGDAAVNFRDQIPTFKLLLQNKRFRETTKLLYHSHSLLSDIVNGIPNKYKELKKHKHKIIQVIDRFSGLVKKEKLCSAFGISSQTFNNWKNECKNSIRGLCFKKHPFQLSISEVNTIKKYMEDSYTKAWDTAAVFFHAQREGNANFSLDTWYKYVRALGLSRQRRRKRANNYLKVRASKIKQIVHMDVTEIKCLNNTKVYLYVIIDNFSRYILNYKISLRRCAKTCMENLNEAAKKFNLFETNEKIQVWVDDGIENKGEVDQFISTHENQFEKITARTDEEPRSNSMVEHTFNKLKHQHFFKRNYENTDQVFAKIPEDIFEHNNIKPKGVLHGLTSHEVFVKQMTPIKNRWMKNHKEIRALRKQENIKSRCPSC